MLLLAHGTPDSPDQIPEYLANITGGRPLPAAAIEEVRRRYTLVGQSPLTRISLDQARLLHEWLRLPVYLGMRNWSPYIRDAIARMRQDGIRQAVAICLAPQNSRTSVGLYRRVTLNEAADDIEIEFVESWAGHPELAQAFRERLEPVWKEASRKAGRKVPVLFTAHSVPCRTMYSTQAAAGHSPEGAALAGSSADPDPYSIEAKRTASNVAALLASEGLRNCDWFFAFQSQGMSGGPWIGPTVEETLTALKKEGHRTVVIQPVGFLADHVEILYDIDIGFRDFAAEIGLELLRAPSLNDSPRLTAALADLAKSAFLRLDKSRSDERPMSAPAVVGS